MESVPCPACNTFFVPRNKFQIFCSEPGCQRTRKALWQKQKLASDPDYKEGQRLSQKNGFKTILITGKNIVAGTRRKLVGIVLSKKSET